MPKVTFLPGAKNSEDANRRNRAKQKQAYIPSFSQAKPKCPTGSSAALRKHHAELCGRLDEIGLCSETFSDIILMTARKLEEIERLTEALRKGGVTYTATNTRSGETTIRQRPEALMLRHATTSLRALLHDVGLTPGEHARVGLRRAADPRGSASIGDWGDM